MVSGLANLTSACLARRGDLLGGLFLRKRKRGEMLKNFTPTDGLAKADQSKSLLMNLDFVQNSTCFGIHLLHVQLQDS